VAEIMVIEDDEAVRSIIAGFLTRAGHAVHEAANGAEGIAKFRARQPALVVTDIFMPQTEGLETIRELRRENPELPIIAVSGDVLGDGFYLKAATALGATAALAKPFDKSDLLTLVDKCLSACKSLAADDC
jgi:CheY-like chemotaxis protein